MATKAKELIKLAKDFAKEKGFELSKTEKKLLTSVAEGKEANYSSTDEAENDPKKGDTWDKSRSPNVDVIIWLCTDKEAISYLTHRGISITGAKIEGCLDLDFIDLDVPLVFRSCYFTEGIKLECARVKLLNFSGSYIIQSIASRRNAIFAQNADIKTNVFLSDNFHAKGQVSFYGATIGGTIYCRMGSFDSFGDTQGSVILAENANIKGNVFFDNGFQAKGEVSFNLATIGGNFEANQGIFENPNGYAIRVSNTEIKGSVLLCDGFQAKGKVAFTAATIGMSLLLLKVKNTEDMTLFLNFANIYSLCDQKDSWPEQNNLYLEGLVYNSITNGSTVDSQSRLKWIRLQNLKNNFSPQPYEQLAKVLRMSGHEQSARNILRAKENDLRRYGNLGIPSQVLNCFLDITIGHGYSILNMVRTSILLLIIGGILFSCGQSHNLMSPSKILAYNHSETNYNTDSKTNQKQTISEDYPKFNAFMYSVDAFVPIINFHQQDYWLPNTKKKTDIEIPLNSSNQLCYKNTNSGSLLRWYLWFHIFMGWFLTSLAVAAFTGLTSRLG